MKRPFFISGISILITIIICETAWYYGYEKSLLPVSAFISALIGAIFLLSAVPDIQIPDRFKKYFILISSCVLIGSVLWSYSNFNYRHIIQQSISSKNKIFTISDKVNIKTYNGYLTNIICNETGAVISFKTVEKMSVVPDDIIIANITKSVDQKNRTYNRSNGINFIGEATGRIILVKNTGFSFNRIFYNIRHEISKHIGLEAGKAYGFLNALILGDKSGLSSEEKTVLQSAGVYHVCAVSGLHVSIVALFLGYIVSLFKIKKSLTKLFLILPGLFILLAVTGFSISAIRAVFMAFSFLLGKSFYRKADSLNILGLILTLILIISPFSAFSPSLLLTFSATTGIILLASGLKKEIITGLFLQTGHVLSKRAGYLVGILSVSIAATSFTVIVSEVFFSRTTVIGVLANLIVLQLVTIVYILALIMIIFSFIPFCAPLTLFFSQLVTLGVNLIMSVSTFFANSFFAKTDLALGTIIVCALIALIVAIFYYFKNMPKPKKAKKKYIAYSAAVFAITFIISLFGGTAIKAIFDPDDGLYHIAYIDVGQGMSSVLSYGNHAVIIDCGGSKNASYAINNYLHSKSIRNVDTIIVSHLHSDHCNALNTLLDEWNVKEVIIPYTEGDPAIYIDLIETADSVGTEVIEIDRDDTRKLGDMSVFILTNHLNEENTDQNDNCIAVVAEIVNLRALFPGDLTEVSEETITTMYGDFLDCDFLSIPHHGSKYSSSKLFLDNISPIISIISVGKNSFGHPAKETIERIEASSSKILTTIEYGTIEIISDGINYNVVYGK